MSLKGQWSSVSFKLNKEKNKYHAVQGRIWTCSSANSYEIISIQSFFDAESVIFQ